MKNNYHAHTPWSHHASITAEDSIKEAIERGFETFGFSEHINLKGSLEGFRMRHDKDLHGFLEDIKDVREKYQGQINIPIGLEVEYRNETTNEIVIDEINELVNRFPQIDYLLYAGHFYSPGRHIFMVYPTKDEINQYLEDMDKALEKLDIKYIVHPDGWAKGMQKWTEDSEVLANGIIDLSLKYDVPLGLNANGSSYDLDFCYPLPKFWELVSKKGAKVILELDSHSKRAISQERIDLIEKMAQTYNLNVIEKLDI